MLRNPAEYLPTVKWQNTVQSGALWDSDYPSCEFIKLPYKSLKHQVKIQLFIPDEENATCM